MQKNLSETAKRRMRRTRNAVSPGVAGAPDGNVTISQASSSRHRATLGPLELQQSSAQRVHSDSLLRRRVGTDRMSMLPSQMPLEGPRQVAVEPDNGSLQSDLLYDEYLQGIATIECLKRKTKETEKKILAELVTISKEVDYDREKCFKLKAREIDIVQLSAAMHEVDSQIADCHCYTKNNKIEAFADALYRLYTYLEPLDILECQNIVLPKTENDWRDIEGILKKCFVTLQSIAELIGSKGEVYTDVHDGIKEYIESHSEMESYLKRVLKALSDLQILVLKTASLSPKEDDDIDI